jgi:hypothetical protein
MRHLFHDTNFATALHFKKFFLTLKTPNKIVFLIFFHLKAHLVKNYSISIKRSQKYFFTLVQFLLVEQKTFFQNSKLNCFSRKMAKKVVRIAKGFGLSKISFFAGFLSFNLFYVLYIC